MPPDKTYADGILDGMAFAAVAVEEAWRHHQHHNGHRIAVRDWAAIVWAWQEAIYAIRQLEVATELAMAAKERDAK